MNIYNTKQRGKIALDIDSYIINILDNYDLNDDEYIDILSRIINNCSEEIVALGRLREESD